MSEEAAAFARHDDNPFPIVPDDAADAAEATMPDDTGADPNPATTPEPEEHGFTDRIIPDPIIGAIRAPDSRQFIRALITHTMAAADDASLGIALSRLGHALAEDGQDEALTFQTLVDDLGRGRVDQAALRGLTPVIVAFVARLVAGGNPSDDAEALRHLAAAAETVVGETLEAGGSRAWRRLPRFAATIADRAAQRELPLGAVADMLPRLGGRFGLTRNEPAGRGTVISLTDDLRGDPPRGAAADEPRRLVISGPVEIVILDR
ncbi:MAG TPA: hypothetical protein VGG57_13820 [Stellaceae bacterium]|jgi:hypothetical protein